MPCLGFKGGFKGALKTPFKGAKKRLQRGSALTKDLELHEDFTRFSEALSGLHKGLLDG